MGDAWTLGPHPAHKGRAAPNNSVPAPINAIPKLTATSQNKDSAASQKHIKGLVVLRNRHCPLPTAHCPQKVDPQARDHEHARAQQAPQAAQSPSDGQKWRRQVFDEINNLQQLRRQGCAQTGSDGGCRAQQYQVYGESHAQSMGLRRVSLPIHIDLA